MILRLQFDSYDHKFDHLLPVLFQRLIVDAVFVNFFYQA